MRSKPVELGGVFDAVEAGRPVSAGSGHDVACWREVDGVHAATHSWQIAFRLACRHVPEPHLALRRRGGRQPTVRGPGHPSHADTVFAATPQDRFGAVPGVPDPCRCIGRGGDKPAARKTRHGPDSVAMAHQLASTAVVQEPPHPQNGIGRNRCQP